MFDGRGDAFEVLNWPEANEKIQQLPQRNVERANAATHGRGQRSFDSDQILAERFHRVVRQPFIELVLRCLTGENFEPRDFLPAAICLFDCRIEHAHTRRPDIRPCPVSANERNDRLIRHIQSVGSGNFFARGRSNIFVRHKAETVEAAAVQPQRNPADDRQIRASLEVTLSGSTANQLLLKTMRAAEGANISRAPA